MFVTGLGDDDAEVALTRSDRGEGLFGIGDRHRDRRVRPRAPQVGEDRRQHVAADGQARGHGQGPAAGLVEFVQVSHQFPGFRKGLAGPPVHLLPRLGQLHPLTVAIEDLHTEPVLQRAQMSGHNRLGNPEVIGSARDAVELDHGAEHLELLERDAIVVAGRGADRRGKRRPVIGEPVRWVEAHRRGSRSPELQASAVGRRPGVKRKSASIVSPRPSTQWKDEHTVPCARPDT